MAMNEGRVPAVGQWHVAGGRVLTTPEPFGIMGIVNLTPDSFSDGGRYEGVGGIRHALRLVEAGADVVDLGAESTRPGATPVSPAQEQARLVPVVAALRQRVPYAVLSVDTCHAATAAAALDMGVAIINDVSGCTRDPALVDVLVQYKPGYVLTHGRGVADAPPRETTPEALRRDVREFFERRGNELVRAGLPENRLVLDPGLGFGKTAQQNICLLTHVDDWLTLGRPVLVGLSRKSFLGHLLGVPPQQRDTATAAAAALIWTHGVFWHRVHAVADVRQALTVAAALQP